MTDPQQLMEKVVSPGMAGAILDRGYCHLGGAVVVSADLRDEDRTTAGLAEAWRLSFPGSPFESATEHLDLVRFPLRPTMSLRRPTDDEQRRWPTYSNGFLAGSSLAPVWVLERTRMPPGTELWRVHRSGDHRLLATFRGAATGWTGATGYEPPVDLVGTRATWRGLDVPAELTPDGTAVELIVVGHQAPPEFTEVRTGVWHQVVPRGEVDAVFEVTVTTTVDNLPCQVIGHGASTTRVLLGSADPDDVRRLGATLVDIGVFEATVPTTSLRDPRGTMREFPDAPAEPAHAADGRSATGLVEHLEHRLGPVVGGWSQAPDGRTMPFQLVEFAPPNTNELVFMTLGLSHRPVLSLITGEPTRLELLMATRRGDDHRGQLLGLLAGLGEMIVHSGEAFEQGDLAPNSSALREISTMNTLYGRPADRYLPADGVFVNGDVEVGVLQLVPVSDAEATFVRGHSVAEFEALLARNAPDVLDYRRDSLLP